MDVESDLVRDAAMTAIRAPKIDPGRRPAVRADGSPDDNDRVEIGPTSLAFTEWARAGLTPPNLGRMRRFRLDRLVDQLRQRGLDGVLLTDPLNIRYATDTTNMSLWNAHNPFRAVLVTADGYVVLWDFKRSTLLSAFNPLVNEVRGGASLFYFVTGDRAPAAAREFAGQIRDLLTEHGDGKVLAVDKLMRVGFGALAEAGVQVVDGEIVTEHARIVKGPDEILAMRCAIHSCEVAMAVMRDTARPGMTEDDIWAVLHAENIRRGGEWIETRLLSTGPRTNPWYQECGPRVLQDNEILAFDTDLIGVYGMCADLSRTWWIGSHPPRQDMIDDYHLALDHLQHNTALLGPGVTFAELSQRIHVLPCAYQEQKYSCAFHGVGLCDEWPHIDYPDSFEADAFTGELEPGMTLCVESLVSRAGGDFSIKLEDQVLITEQGCENLTRAPHDAALAGVSKNGG